jgi:flagellin-like hook-associated protein FlgL
MTTVNQIGRTSTLMASDQLLSSLRRTQLQLLDAQRAVSTGVDVATPSEFPARTAAILNLQQRLEGRGQHERNLAAARTLLDSTDAALSDVGDLLLEAKTVASSQIGLGSDAQTRSAQAGVIREQLRAAIELGNRQLNGVSLFGGRASGDAVFQDFLGGVRYTGSTQNLLNDLGLDQLQGVNSNGHEAFGALSSRVRGAVDLDPQATAATRLVNINGTLDRGVRLGQVSVTVNATQVIVDLTGADTLGDVATRVNEAIDGVSPGAGSLALAGDGFTLTAGAGHTVTLADVGAGRAAADLGLELTAASGSVAGGDVDPRLTEQTAIASLGVTVDWLSGLKITQGGVTRVADFSAATTVQDLINAVGQLDLGLRLEIDAEGTSLNLFSDVSGIDLSVGENAGGATATDLGLRTYGLATRLEDFRFGLGIEPKPGGADFRVQLHSGGSFDVDADGLGTVADLIAAITAAATGAGLSVGAPGDAGTDLNVGLASDGNGLRLEDGTAGGADFRVLGLNASSVAAQLGIEVNAGAGAGITGEDRAKVRVESVFTHLLALQDALATNSEAGIRVAGDGIEGDIDQVTRARGDLGARTRRVEQQQERSEDLKILEQSVLSDLRDADLTEVVTRFQQLQQQVQAALTVGAQNLRLSFLDFLR